MDHRCLLLGEAHREVLAQLRGHREPHDFIQDFDIDANIDYIMDFVFDTDFDLIFDVAYILDYDITFDFGGIYIELFDFLRRHGHGRHPQEAGAGDGAHWQEA